MAETAALILGEFRRTIDDRFRLSIPTELAAAVAGDDGLCVLVKERAGCLSLWERGLWKQRMSSAVEVVESKWRAGRLNDRLHDLQSLGRLLSTRHTEVQLAGRGRLVIPDPFRDFLAVEAGGELQLIGAAVCIEIWQPASWLSHLNETIPEFGKRLEELVG